MEFQGGNQDKRGNPVRFYGLVPKEWKVTNIAVEVREAGTRLDAAGNTKAEETKHLQPRWIVCKAKG